MTKSIYLTALCVLVCSVFDTHEDKIKEVKTTSSTNLITTYNCHPDRTLFNMFKKVQVGKDQEKAQSEKDSHSKNRGGKKPN